MKTARTRSCTDFDHPEFQFQYQDLIPQQDADWLIRALEFMTASGSQFTSGESIEIGPSILLANQNGDRLMLSEPDFESMPIAWVLGVTQSLHLLRFQKDLAESYELEAEFTSLQHSCIVGVDVDSSTNEFGLARDGIEDNDTGWFIGALESKLNYNDPANLRRMSIYEAMLLSRQFWPFLALPSNCRVASAADGFAVWKNGEPLQPQSESFADQYRTKLAN